MPSRHGSTEKRGIFFFFCKLSELLHSDHTEHVNIYTQRGGLARVTQACASSAFLSLLSLKCGVFLPFAYRCPGPPPPPLSEGVTFLFLLLFVLQGDDVRVMEPGTL